MAKQNGPEAILPKTEVHENPLVPNRRLREMYVAMVEARLLDEHLLKHTPQNKSPRKLPSIHGQEACRVSTAIDLQPGDLISDTQPGLISHLLAGVTVERLLRGMSKEAVRGRQSTGQSIKNLPSVMAWMKPEDDRLRLAMGAALLLKIQKRTNLVVAYTRRGETRRGEWRAILEIASSLELPILFVVLPSSVAGANKDGRTPPPLGTKLGGVPAIAADSGDAVALYRVAQEAFGRIRGGGGPALVDCVLFSPKRKRSPAPADPVLQMKTFLLARSIATQSWLDQVEKRMQKRIERASR